MVDLRVRGKAHRKRRHRISAIEPLERRDLLAASPLITEIVASNDSTLLDIDGTSADWIELHNPGSQPINLDGWSLTDDMQRLDKWKLPYVTLDAGDYLVVFASAKDRPYDSYRLTTDFNATADGTFLVDLPVGRYDVRLTLGDAARARDKVDIYVQDTLVDTVTTAAGAFVAKTFPFEVNAT